ncbi:MAG: phospholipase D family protein [Ignavibacteria bacterium]|nr:phospholipase D family protein [Ignavibacteria bacterium]
MQYKFLICPWQNEFIETISKTENELFISSPFVNLKGVKILIDSIKEKSKVKITLLTNLTPQNIINESIDPRALLELYKHFAEINISSLSRLHAKVYLIDEKIGIITSANLTSGGLIHNFEYGVLIDNKNTVLNIKEDMSNYYSLGNILDEQVLKKISDKAKQLYKINKKRNVYLENSTIGKLLKEELETIEFELLKNRIKEGRTINAIFSDTILYLLKKKGELRTDELHPLIQAIHPDICDDSIDRVINGQHFGKKWKHLVRNAQQSLKKNGLIRLQENKWQIVI